MPRTPIGLLALFVVTCVTAPSAIAQTETPNVLILYSGQHTDIVLGAAGFSAISTPNLDRLADEGALFRSCAASHPLSTPSRGTMQTGLYAELHGADDQDDFLDPSGASYLAEIFEDAGYATGYAGKWDLDGARDEDGDLTRVGDNSYVPPERRRGYQEWYGYQDGLNHDEPAFWDDDGDEPILVFPTEYDWELSFHRDVVIDFTDFHGGLDTPWMYFLSIGMPHPPEEAPSEFLDDYPSDEIATPSWIARTLVDEELATAQAALQTYYAQVSFIDDEIGRILDALEDQGQADNTIVIYTSDSGDLLGSHWGEVWSVASSSAIEFRESDRPFQNAFRVPLIMRWPELIPAGVIVDALISNVDIPPTLLSLAGLSIPSAMQGVNMEQWALGNQGPDRNAVYLSRQGDELPDWTGVWTGDYLYSQGDTYPILYEHSSDPYETVNLFDQTDAEEIQLELDERLEELKSAALAEGNSGEIDSDDGSSDKIRGLVPCFIATAAYGTPYTADLDALRDVRDAHLLDNRSGTAFVDTYYRLSPAVAEQVARSPRLAAVVRTILKPVAAISRLLDGAKDEAPPTD